MAWICEATKIPVPHPGVSLGIYLGKIKDEKFKAYLARQLRTIIALGGDDDKMVEIPTLEMTYALIGKATIRLNRIDAFLKSINDWENRYVSTTRIKETEHLRALTREQLSTLTKMALAIIFEKEKANAMQSVPAPLPTDPGQDGDMPDSKEH